MDHSTFIHRLRRAHHGIQASLCALAFACLAPAFANDDWPAPGRNVRLIVPSPGGSGTGDTIGRLFAEELSKRLKVPVVVDNKPGANGNIGASAAAQAPHDGYHFLFSWAGTLAVNQAMYKQMGYDSQRDFAPIALLAEVPNILVVNLDLPVKNLAELTRYAKSFPGKLVTALPASAAACIWRVSCTSRIRHRDGACAVLQPWQCHDQFDQR